jgi:C4-dicarboxylate-specific signal transduction histidine kinase
MGFSLVVFAVNLIKGFMDLKIALSAAIILIPFSFFISLYFLSRKGFFLTASYCLLTIFFLLVTYEIYNWGADLPSGLLTYVLVIVMAGVLISTRFAFIATIIISLTLATVGYLQINNIINLNAYWKNDFVSMADFIVFVVIFLIIATVSWLSNREIEKSLIRARRSETELKKERDSLEVTDEKRTQQLKDEQSDKIAQLYRFAEFGRLSAGVFHDLVNPLTAVSLNMEKVKAEYGKEVATSEAKMSIDRAVLAAKKMENFVVAVRKQLAREENNTRFSLNEEIGHVVGILSHKAQKAHVTLHFSAAHITTLFGDAAKFNQVVLNLIANAIESYVSTEQDDPTRKVDIALTEKGDVILLSIKDFGIGIVPENIEKIFDPFFTTKIDGQGIGIGLSLSKRIVEKDFHGSIDVKSKVGEGTVFTIQLLSKKNEK